MKIFFRLCCSIVRKNKGFTAGLLIMYVLSAAIALLGANFGPSADETVMNFITDSGLPDLVYMTELLSEEYTGKIGAIPGVRSVSAGFIYDTRIRHGDTVCSVRMFRQDPDSPYRQTIHAEAVKEEEGGGLQLSAKFAKSRRIAVGDRLLLEVPSGPVQLPVSATVSNPETISCVRDEMSSYESDQFGYVYLNKDRFDDLLGTDGQANRWMIWTEEEVSGAEREAVMKSVRGIFGAACISETETDESEALNSLRDDLGTIDVLCSFIPIIIWLISLGFGFIFIRIISENQRKTIGLLRALGFSARKVVLLFAAYSLLISLAAVLIGIPLGYALLILCLKTVSSAEGILEITVVLRYGVTAGMMLLIFIVGIVSTLLSARSISSVDPCLAYGGQENTAFEPPVWMSRLKTDAFFKISLVSILRSIRRQTVGVLCITACVISMCIGFEGVMTIGYPIDAVYGGRYRYDLFIRGIDRETADRLRNAEDCFDRAEPFTWFTAELSGDRVRVSTLPDGTELTMVTDAEGNRLAPGDGLIIDEMRAELSGLRIGDPVTLDGYELTVTGIAREILFNILYISPETAEKLGHGEINSVMLRIKEGTGITEAKNTVSAIAENAYITEFAAQKKDIRDAFRPMRTIMLIFSLLAFGIGSLLILNMTLIDFYEKRNRYVILRALGTTVRRMSVVSLAENLFRVIPGVAIACPLCHICVAVLLKLLSNASQQYVFVEYPLCLTVSCLIPVLYILLGTGVSARRIRKMDLCADLNEVE